MWHSVCYVRPTILDVLLKLGSACIANRLTVFFLLWSMRTKLGLWPTDTLEINIYIYNLISYQYRENIPGLCLCLDFKKAFGSVDWKFKFNVVRAFGFESDICQWISTFYKDVKSSVTVNGQLSQWYFLLRTDVDKGTQYHQMYLINV